MATVDMSRIAGNISALNALNSLNNINNSLSIHQTRLATGKRINSASDDPAGIVLATTFDVRRQGMKVALDSIGTAKNVTATMEGGLGKVKDILVKMRNKALEGKTDALSTAEYEAIETQLNKYRAEIDDIVNTTQWNGRYLLSGGSAGGATGNMNFVVDSDGGVANFEFEELGDLQDNQGFAASGASASGAGLGLTDTIFNDISSGSAGVDGALQSIDNALSIVKSGLGEVGSFSARLTFKEEALTVAHANVEAAYNRIMNANMAEEQVEASKYSILQQTATTMLSQANVAPQFLLSLFR